MERRVGFWGFILRVLAIGYPLAILGIILVFRLIGERWWVVTILLYLPRWGFALPLPFLTLWILFTGPRRLLIYLAVGVALLVFPLMGLHLSGAVAATPGAFRLRLITYNIDAGQYGPEAILGQIRVANADVILLQEARPQQTGDLKAGLPGYFFHEHDQFMIASRYPIQNAYQPPPLQNNGRHRSPRFVGYELVTPRGIIQVYNVHPISPRDALEDLRGNGLRSELTTGHIFHSGVSAEVAANASLRMAQLEAIAFQAARSSHPVLIAGDTNLPSLSWGLAHWLGDYQDGFTQRGSGFGYTFPSPKRPWMRIDRILADARFRILSFTVLHQIASDHLAVTAEIELAATP